MFFIKKTVIFFINPLVMYSIFLGVAFFLWKKKKNEKLALKFFLIPSLILLVLSMPSVSKLIARPLEVQNPPIIEGIGAKYIAVLGSGHHSTEGFPGSLQLSSTARSRLMEGLRQLQLNPDAKLIFFGFGFRGGIPHGEVMTRAAIELGIPSGKIVFSDQPKDTNEEAAFAKEICGDSKLLLVTDATHSVRAMMLFKHYGIDVYAAPSNYESYGEGWFVPIPGANALELTRKSIYEYVGLLWVKIRTF